MALYRLEQFRLALLGRVSEADMREARHVLGPDLYGLFAAMPAQYRHHMLAVYRRVRESGCESKHVLQAALLHDSGKYDPATGTYVTVPYRVLTVVLEATAPGRALLHALTRDAGDRRDAARSLGVRYPLYLSAHHPELGARRAAQYGAHPEVVGLIRDHQKRGGPRSTALSILQAADDKS